jgi:Fic family protein
MRQLTVDIDDRKDDLNEFLDGDAEAAADFWAKLDRSWVYHENALEGVVITSDEMAAALDSTHVVSEVSKAAFLADIRRQRDAIRVVKQEAANARGKITPVLVQTLFETLTGGEQGRGKIEYRKDMPLHRTYFHEIGQPARIIPDLTKILEWTTSSEFANLHPLQQAAVFHHKFMAVFPFTDLSGKVGRLILDIMVMRAGYMPAVIHAIDRQRYYDSLRQQPRVLQSVMTEAIENVTELGLKWFGQGAQQAKASNG